MTDDQNPQNLTPPDPPAPDDRAPDDMRTERAFRDAFATHADDVNSEGVTIPTRTAPRLHWLAVAAAVIVVAMIGALAIRQFSSYDVAATDSSPSTTPSTLGSPSAPVPSPTPTPVPPTAPSLKPSQAPPSTVLSGLPAPMDGFQWVSSRDVAVQVPAEWDYATAPGGDCPSVPYYSSFTGSLARMAIGCPGPLPREQDVMHLALSSPYGDPVDHQAWHRTRDMGNVLVTVAVPSGLAADEALADKILATARTFIRDHVGCAPRSPIDLWAWTRPSEKFDVTAVGQIDSLSLCQYQKSPESAADSVPGPRLIASQRLTGDAARAMLSAIQQSPVGGGPNLPDSCLAEYHDTSAIVVRLATAQGVRELYATVGNCRNNGIDDGTNLRAVTPGWCSPLFTKPLLWSSMSGAVASLCDPAGQVPGATPSPTR